MHVSRIVVCGPETRGERGGGFLLNIHKYIGILIATAVLGYYIFTVYWYRWRIKFALRP